ncbi:MAG: enoyl-CoA hydratase/isomerase family protein [Sandaracinaceae bacterium]|nr:enoyl-CoA hydratase/isomerase family protein [Sandaracinaceae bacterium]
MSEPQRVRVEDQDGVRVLTLTRPEKKNAFDVAQASQLWAAIEAAASDDAVRVVALTAEGDYFSGGADVSIFLNIGSTDPMSLAKVGRLYEPLRACAKPTIAIVQGHCVGMGVTLLPHFDMVYAADHVTFRTPFVQLGLVLEYGSSDALPRLIGPQRTKELILRAAPIDAKTAVDWGLVTRTFGADALREEAMKIATDIAALPPGAVQESKRLIDQVTASFDASTQAEDAALASRYGSPENVAAVMAIMSRKKKPA